MKYTDFHAHILPGADHGGNNIETSLYQLREAEKARVGTIFVTPHFYVDEDTIPEFLERRERTYNELKNAAAENDIRINLIKSAEVNLQMGLTELPELEKLCIGNTKYMLLEMPFDFKWGEWVYNSIDLLRNRGIEPIIAHIDRYDDDLVARLFDYDVKMQINAEPFASLIRRRKYIKYAKQGLVHFLGSDIHQYGKHYENYQKAAKLLGISTMNRFTRNAQKLFTKR